MIGLPIKSKYVNYMMVLIIKEAYECHLVLPTRIKLCCSFVFYVFVDYNLPCTQDIPTCGDTCGKQLDCGIHTCTQRCHTGPCGTV